MQLTKQQMIVGAVLTLAVAAFVTDRWVIGHEDESLLVAPEGVARVPAGPRRPAPRQATPAVAAAADEAGFVNVSGLAARLENLRMNGGTQGRPMHLEAVRDAFRPPPALVGSRRVETRDESQDAVKRFVDRHKLAAVVRRQSGGGIAIIEDKTLATGSLTLRVGQKLDGFTLVAVKDRVAILRRGTEKVELRLQEDPNQATIIPSEKMVGVDPVR